MPGQPFHDPPRMPRGFACAARNVGLKPSGEPDLALFVSAVDAAAAGVFTLNHVCGAPVTLGRELLRAGRLRGVVVNSRVSNVGNGAEGLVWARRMGAAAAAEVGCAAEAMLVASTGVIGVPLPIERIEEGLVGMGAELTEDPLVGARGIMTTDTYPKALSLSVGEATLTLVAKGAGMIEPNMATMLAYVFTDAAVSAPALDTALRAAVDRSFNMLSVDTDTSTSDMCVALANGLAGPVEPEAFAAALADLCVRGAELIARDGEGATRLLRAHVRGAADVQEARAIARSIIRSPLVKTMVYGQDPNVGRILMAVGKCVECRVDPERIGATINGVQVLAEGRRAAFEDARVRELLGAEEVDLEVELHLGEGCATAYGCDLTEGYIRENASYYSS